MDPTSATSISPLALAVVAILPPLLLAGLTGWIMSRKEKRDAERAITAAQAAAVLKRDEKLEDWRRQDEVADRVAAAAAEVAKQAADAADLLVQAQQDTITRTDEVARQGAAAATLLLAAQRETIARTDEVARLAEAADQRTHAQLTAVSEQATKIHILVNNDMTIALANEREAMRRLVGALRHSADLSAQFGVTRDRRVAGGPPVGPEAEEIRLVEQRIGALDEILAERRGAQIAVEEEARKHAATKE